MEIVAILAIQDRSLQMVFIKFIVLNCLKFRDYNYDFLSSSGFSCTFFGMYYILCSFNSIADSNHYFLSFLPIRKKFLPFFYLMLNQMINPKSSYLGHLSGIISGVLIKEIFVYLTLPRKSYINSFEDKFSTEIDYIFVKKFNYVRYSSITSVKDLEDLNELDKGFSDFFLIKYVRNFVNKYRHNQNRNNSKEKDLIVASSNNNNDIPREIPLRDINRLNEEV